MIAMPFVHDPWIAVTLAAMCLAGGGGIFALLTADMLARVSPALVSTAGGLTAAAQSLAYVVANPLVGRAVDLTHSYALVLVVLGALVLPAVVAWTLWPVKR
jgi:NADH:ubiquinone oxidoreductase subunit H